jgi:hypothetical protein
MYSMEYYSGRKRELNPVIATTLMELELIMLSEIASHGRTSST